MKMFISMTHVMGMFISMTYDMCYVLYENVHKHGMSCVSYENLLNTGHVLYCIV
jgi:hypothetical protein